MQTKLIAALLVTASASFAAPAFAGGYGPAPFYNPEVGAPSSQRGQSEQTLVAEQNNSAVTESAVGGVEAVSAQSGGPRAQATQGDDAPRGR
jgi:hypothetical protein